MKKVAIFLFGIVCTIGLSNAMEEQEHTISSKEAATPSEKDVVFHLELPSSTLSKNSNNTMKQQNADTLTRPISFIAKNLKRIQSFPKENDAFLLLINFIKRLPETPNERLLKILNEQSKQVD